MFNRLLGLLGVLCALLCGPAAAGAQIPAALRGQRVVDVQVVGEARGRVSQRALGIPLGAPLSRALLRGAITRLLKRGRWSDVQVDAERAEGGVRLLVHLSPQLVAERVDVVGNQALDDREITRLLGVRPEQTLDRDRVPEWVKALEARYERAGYRQAQVRVMLRDTSDPARKVLRVEVREGAPTRIQRIVYVGEPLPKRKGLRRAFGLGRGDILDREAVEDAVKRAERQLRRAGYYAARLGTPSYRFRGRRAEVRIPSAVGPRYEVQLSGVGPLKRSEVFGALRLSEDRLASGAALRALEARVTDLYKRRGFDQARVRVWTVPPVDEESPAYLRVLIRRGTQLQVVAVGFPGAEHFSQSYLREQLYSYLEEDLPGSTVERPVDDHEADRLGFGGQFGRGRRESPPPLRVDPRRTYYPPTYAEAIEHIRELYRAQGFLRARVGPVELRPLQGEAAEEAARRGVRGAVAVVPVAEGPRTFIYEVHVDNNVQVTKHDALRALALPRGAPFSYLGLEEARVRLLDAYKERGFYYARAEPHVRFSDDGTRAEVRFEVVERFPVRVGAIVVRGAQRSSERMIRNRLFFRLGDLYRPSVERRSKQALDDLGIFSTVTIAPDEIELPARVKTVVVTVSEERTQQLDANAGFSTGEGARAGFGYRYRNLLGSALRAELRAELGYQFVFLDDEIQERFENLPLAWRLEYQASVALGVPYIPAFPRLQSTVDFVVMQDLQRDFRLQKESVVWTVFYKLPRRVTFSLAQGLEESTFDLLALFQDNIGNLTTGDLVPYGDNTLLSTKFTASWDRRRREGERFGLLLSGSVEYATTVREQPQEVPRVLREPAQVVPGTSALVRRRLQADRVDRVLFESNMLRLSASAELLFGLGRSMVLVVNPRWGRIVHLDERSESFPNRRFYLGGVNFRGFQQNQMIPQDLEDQGKTASNILSRGGETFLAVQSELRFPLIGQLQGAVLADVGNLWSDPAALDPLALDTTLGLGLRIDMTVALLALDYGVRVDPENFGGAFQFSFRSQ